MYSPDSRIGRLLRHHGELVGVCQQRSVVRNKLLTTRMARSSRRRRTGPAAPVESVGVGSGVGVEVLDLLSDDDGDISHLAHLLEDDEVQLVDVGNAGNIQPQALTESTTGEVAAAAASSGEDFPKWTLLKMLCSSKKEVQSLPKQHEMLKGLRAEGSLLFSEEYYLREKAAIKAVMKDITIYSVRAARDWKQETATQQIIDLYKLMHDPPKSRRGWREAARLASVAWQSRLTRFHTVTACVTRDQNAPMARFRAGPGPGAATRAFKDPPKSRRGWRERSGDKRGPREGFRLGNRIELARDPLQVGSHYRRCSN
jgi:hypothetical protein